MQNRDDVDGSQRPRTVDAPKLDTPAGAPGDPAGHLGPAGDPVEGEADAIEDDLADQDAPAKA